MYNIPIEQIIGNQITVQDYFDLMLQLLEDLEETRNEGVQIVLATSRMRVRDGKLQREVDPDAQVREMADIKEFVRNMTFDCVFHPDENCAAVTKFLQTIDSVSEINFFNVMIQFCKEQLGLVTPMRSPSGRLVSGRTAPAPAPAPAPYQGSNDGETGVLSDDFWQKFGQQTQAQPQTQYQQQPQYQQTQYQQTQYQQQYQQPENSYGNGYANSYGNQGGYSGYEAMGGTGGETGVLDPNFWQQIQGGASQGAQGAQRRNSGRLVHAKTGNVTVINKENFWIGKGDVDLKIDKDTVSRKHAQILVRQNHYFITDNGSTNKTYLEGKELPPNASVELYNGMHVKFANEEYIFQL
ncbi:MAG: FHA domain-containing protein [Lachnospiraceae bacterium]|nr:FHA domain-containing protein [Lachnospiraceae bacterium]